MIGAVPAVLATGSPGEVVLSGPVLVAVLVAGLAGLVSFLSPCVLPLLPAYLSYVSGLTVPGAASRRRVVAGTTLFVTGFAAVFVSYGAAFGGLGSMLREHDRAITVVLGMLTILLGLAFGGWIPGTDRQWRLMDVSPGTGLAAAPVLGVLFGIGWTPCIGPTLAAVQALAFSSAGAERGAALSLAYCVGLGVPFLVAGLAYERSMSLSRWFGRSGGYRWVQRLGAAMLVLIGVALITGWWTALVAQMQGWTAGFEVPL